MSRVVIIAIFSLGVRVFAAPSLCAHMATNSVSNEMVESQMACDEHMESENKTSKHVPCNHMKQCLQDVGDDNSFIQKSASTVELANGVFNVYFVPALSQILPVTSEPRVFNRAPPETLYAQPIIYIGKSSFLI
jgi:hypothetical protein